MIYTLCCAIRRHRFTFELICPHNRERLQEPVAIDPIPPSERRRRVGMPTLGNLESDGVQVGSAVHRATTSGAGISEPETRAFAPTKAPAGPREDNPGPAPDAQARRSPDSVRAEAGQEPLLPPRNDPRRSRTPFDRAAGNVDKERRAQTLFSSDHRETRPARHHERSFRPPPLHRGGRLRTVASS